ncbi:MAG: DUF2488 family protein [Oscillatoriales cyanobacterium SM2_2_1]|nr:DUF2488 family protein [Oscillatoriales cyanobacterium SM2_2_1]
MCQEERAPLQETLAERRRNYRDRGKEIDFWFLAHATFLERQELAVVRTQCSQPAAAVISTDPIFIRWLKLRLEFVVMGSFESEALPEGCAES